MSCLESRRSRYKTLPKHCSLRHFSPKKERDREMAEKENSSIEGGGEEKKKLGFPFAIFQDFRLPLNFPPVKREAEEVVVSQGKEVSGEGEGSETKAPNVVRVAVPDDRKGFPTLKLESEEEEHGSSRNMWQVYALGGFMILRWLWGRWKESRANNSDKSQSVGDGDEPTNAES